jgi:zinc protease
MKFFKVSPYRLDPLGSAEVVKKLTQKDLQEWQAAYCVPNNMVLAVVGDIDPKAAQEQVTKAFASFAAKPDLKLPSPPAEPPLTRDESFTKKTRKDQAAIYIGFSGMRMSDVTDRYPMDVLDAVLSGVEFPTGWLHNELRGKGLVYLVHANNWEGMEPGYFGAYAGCRPQNVELVVKIMLQKFEEAKDDKITDDEMERAKRMCITTHELNLQRPAAQGGQMALDELYGLGYDFGDKYANQITAVTKEEVRRVAQKYFTRHVVVVTAPQAGAGEGRGAKGESKEK